MSKQNTFSAQLQSLRREKGVTQETLAEHLGVSPQAVSKWENGSYPDGDLLPKLADFFDVSIDHLYGRAERNISVPQQIINELQSLKWENGEPQGFFDKAFGYFWAVLLGCWNENRTYYSPASPDGNSSHTASDVTSKNGFAHMRLNSDLQYFFAAKKPSCGFEKRLTQCSEMSELFAFLGDISNLKVLCFMMSLNNGEVIKASALAKKLNIPREKVTAALGYLCKIGGLHGGNSLFYKTAVIDGIDGSEDAFGTNAVLNYPVLMLFTAADTLLNRVINYQWQTGLADIGWFDRNSEDFLKSCGGSQK